jgi:diguanylate cyclase (GGDEF)-like protein
MGLRLRGARLVVGVMAALAMAPALARAPLEGDPPIARHLPDVDAYPQNFALAQDNQSVVYVGTYDGVLIFDGGRWELLRLPNRDLGRSLAFDGKDRVYVGSHDEFGYLQRAPDGSEQFHDLTGAFTSLLEAGESFEDVWDIHIAREGVFFRALRHLFLYEPQSGATRVWRHAGRFGGIVQHGDRVVLQFRGEGLKQFVNGKWELLPGSEPLHELNWKFLRLPDGGLLGLAADGRWRAFRDGRVSDFPVPASFPESSAMSSGMELPDGTLLLVSNDGTVYTLNPRTGAHRRIRLDTGYLNEVIVDRGGGLLIAGEDRLLHLEWPATWTSLGEAYGLNSSLTNVVRWNQRWVLLTSSGVMEMLDGGDGAPRFRALDWTGGEAWDLLVLDDRTALLADSYDAVLITGNRAQPITQGAFYPRLFRRALGDPGVVLAGLEPGIGVLRRAGGAWKAALEDHSHGDLEVSTMVEAEPRVLWLGSDRGGVWRLTFAPDYGSIVETRRFGPDQGITYGEPAGGSVAQLKDGTLVATTVTGIFRWDGQRFAPWDAGGLDQVIEKGEWVDLVSAPDGTRWAYSHKHVYRETDRGWHREEIGGVRRGALESVAFDETGAAVFTSTRALLRYQPQAPQVTTEPAPSVLLRSLERLDSGGEVERLPVAGPVAVRDGNFGLRVRFALPDFRRAGGTRYAVRLVGLDAQPSAWSNVDTLQYPRLPPGTYRLEVQARDSLGRESKIEPLTLRVLPAWYASPLARGVWVVLGFAALTLLTAVAVRWRTARLEGLVAARTSELRAANERLDAMAHIDGLTGVSNRRELDRHLDKAWAQCAKEGRELAVLAIDVDGFKRYNDQHGHQSGDEMLVRLVREASSCLEGPGDLLARYGGDEFFVVRMGADLTSARALAENLRQRIEAAGLGATVSVGVATRFPRDGGLVKDLVRAADAALYAAKSAGRNRVAA